MSTNTRKNYDAYTSSSDAEMIWSEGISEAFIETPASLSKATNGILVKHDAQTYAPNRKNTDMSSTETKESIFHDDITFFKDVYEMPIRVLVEMNSQHRQILMRKLKITMHWLEGIDRLAINLEEGEV